jgi:uncharacterized protein GlcG (DUF336 family)
MSELPLAKAEIIIDAAIETRRRLGFAGLTVAVLDSGGHLIALKREDHSGILRADIAIGKAWGALGMGFSSREIAARAAKVPVFYDALTAVSQGRLVPGPGGVLVFGQDGALLGAVGISGDTGDNDETCAIAGVEAAGLRSTRDGADR